MGDSKQQVCLDRLQHGVLQLPGGEAHNGFQLSGAHCILQYLMDARFSAAPLAGDGERSHGKGGCQPISVQTSQAITLANGKIPVLFKVGIFYRLQIKGNPSWVDMWNHWW